MGQLIAVLFRTIVVGLFAAWLFHLAVPHPDRRIIALGILILLAVIIYYGIGLLQDLKREYPVAKQPAPGLLAVMEQSVMDETKPWYLSRGILGGAVAAVAGAAQLAGYAVTPADQAALVDGVTQIGGLVAGAGSLLGGLVAIWGRIKASKAIGSTKAA